MRVLFFTESLFPLVDGVSRTLGQLFDFLERHQVDFRVVSPFEPLDRPWSDRVWTAPYARFPWYPDYRISIPRRRIRALAEAYRPDLVHLVSPTPMAVWAKRWSRAHGIPTVASFHTHFVSYFRYYRVRALEPVGWRLLRRFYEGCACVYAPTERIRAELASHGIHRTALWSRGVDVRRFDPAFRDPTLRASAGADESTPILLLVSRLVREKDLLDLIPMTERLRARNTSFRLVVVGDGPLREELRAALPDALFTGHLEGEPLSRWYASADAFVFPSTTETFGNVVAEAQASGLPTIVVDRGGPPELVEEGVTGYVVPPNDPRMMAERAALLMERPELRRQLGRTARSRAAARDWEAVNGQLLASYRTVLREHARDGGNAA